MIKIAKVDCITIQIVNDNKSETRGAFYNENYELVGFALNDICIYTNFSDYQVINVPDNTMYFCFVMNLSSYINY